MKVTFYQIKSKMYFKANNLSKSNQNQKNINKMRIMKKKQYQK